MTKKLSKLSEVKIDKEKLLQKGYSAEDLVGKTIIVKSFNAKKSEKFGEYIEVDIEGAGLVAGKKFSTGAHNIVVKLLAAQEQNMLPLEVKVVKIGQAYDIE